MKIIPLKTGSVKVKKAQQSRKTGGMLRVLAGSEWTEWLPIYAWLIKHPEGNILIDTGETSRTSEPGYFPRWHPYFRYAVKMNVNRDQEIDRQLARHDLAPVDIDTVILTHFHTDHAGGLYHFSHSKILVPAIAYQEAKMILGQLKGYLPQHWQSWFNPVEIEFQSKAYTSFSRSYPLTKDNSIMIVPTPGHTKGHVSVIADTGREKVFIAGDTSYSQDLLQRQQPDGVSLKPGIAVQTQRKILNLAETFPTVYLPSHDPESATRLNNRSYLKV